MNINNNATSPSFKGMLTFVENRSKKVEAYNTTNISKIESLDKNKTRIQYFVGSTTMPFTVDVPVVKVLEAYQKASQKDEVVVVNYEKPELTESATAKYLREQRDSGVRHSKK